MTIEVGRFLINTDHVLFARRDGERLFVIFAGKDAPHIELQGADAETFARQFASLGTSTRPLTKGIL